MRAGYVLDLALTDYTTALALQHDCVAARRCGTLDRDLIIVIEHNPVFTLGRRGNREHLRVSEPMLAQKGIRVLPAERGGDITYHGPGQLVAYPIIDLTGARLKVIELVQALETAMIQTAGHWGIAAEADRPQRGVWVQSRKLGSLGITIRHGISFHGLALNVNTDLEPFEWINPCGLQGCVMTSLALETGGLLPMPRVRDQMAAHLAQLLDLSLKPLALTAVQAIRQGQPSQ